RSGAAYGRGRRRTALTMLNIAVLAPMPSASAMTATAVSARAFKSVRTPKRRSWSRAPMVSPKNAYVIGERQVPFWRDGLVHGVELRWLCPGHVVQPRFVSRTDGLRDRVTCVAHVVGWHARFHLAKVSCQCAIAKHVFDPSREIVATQVSIEPLGRHRRQKADEFLQRARAGAGASIAGE